MKNKNDIEKNLNSLKLASVNVVQAARKENRSLNGIEKDLLNDIQNEIDSLERQLSDGPLTVQLHNQDKNLQTTNQAYALKRPNDKKDYKSLFGNAGASWDSKNDTFFDAVFSGRHDPRLIRASMSETVPSDGGFLVPSELSEKIHAVSLESEIVLPRANVMPMRSNTLSVPGVNIGDHSSSLYGGFTAAYVAETGSITTATPKVRLCNLDAKKLTGMLRFSNELLQDAKNAEDQLVRICGDGLSWYRDKAFLKGSGAGEPLGILNASCTVEVDPEDGQAVDTICYENLTNMVSRLHSGSFKKSVWICHQSTIPQLLQLSIAVGTGGSFIPVLSESNGEFKILTRPVIFTEKTEVLGDKGDIMLVDLSQYLVGLRDEIRIDYSIHVHFETDEMMARLINRHDGMPLWSEALTLEDGSTSVSPFVVLGAR